jgi:hypothetical protein
MALKVTMAEAKSVKLIRHKIGSMVANDNKRALPVTVINRNGGVKMRNIPLCSACYSQFHPSRPNVPYETNFIIAGLFVRFDT